MCSLIFQKASWDSVTWWPQDPKYSSRAAPVYEGFLSLCLGHTGYCPIGQRKWHVPDSKNVGKHLTYWWEDLQYLYCNDVDVGVRRGWGPFLPSTTEPLRICKVFSHAWLLATTMGDRNYDSHFTHESAGSENLSTIPFFPHTTAVLTVRNRENFCYTVISKAMLFFPFC